MRRLVLVVLAGALLLGPGVSLVGVAVLMNPAAHASCVLAAPGAGVSVGDVPGHLDVTTSDGVAIRLNQNQLAHAATVIDIGARTSGVGPDGIFVALMAALTESGVRMLSNTGAYPDSANYPNDGDGGDQDSLGLFQMRPATGWGSVAELMDSGYQARAFYGGPTGPNHGSPRGLLDIPGWRQLPKGAAAQTVEVSAHPDRYARFEPVAEAILEALTRNEPAPAKTVREVPESGRIVFPLLAGTWTRTSGFGMRVHPITGERTLHTGVDLAVAVGTPILATADGKVTFAGSASGYGNVILIEHNIRGAIVVSGYAHMYADGIQVHPGDRVTAGQHIADAGSAGNSTGPHLHFEIRVGASGTPVDPEPWLAGHRAASVDSAAATSGGCGSATNLPAGDPAPYPGGDPNRLVDDPTSEGKITARTAYILAQVQATFPGSSWSCWSPRPGTDSEHPLGRACDGTFGNSIGTPAAGPALEQGWAVVNWLKAHAQQLGVEYLIWQGRIWSVARAAEGWRKYDGGGMHDPVSVTGGHFDHAHWTSDS